VVGAGLLDPLRKSGNRVGRTIGRALEAARRTCHPVDVRGGQWGHHWFVPFQLHAKLSPSSIKLPSMSRLQFAKFGEEEVHILVPLTSHLSSMFGEGGHQSAVDGRGWAKGWPGAVACQRSRFMGQANGQAILKGGGRGSFLGKQPTIVDGISRTSRRWAIAHFYLLEHYSYVGVRRKMTTRTSTLLGDNFWVICPKLEQRREGPPPPCLWWWVDSLFISNANRFWNSNLSTSHGPYSYYHKEVGRMREE
jgi:hypothetical protein